MAEPNPNESTAASGGDSDQDFDPSAEMMVNDFDDEHTLDEEEALADDELANKNEIDELTKEQNIPIEELYKMYGYDMGNKLTSDSKQDSNAFELSDSSNSNLTSQVQSSNLNQQLSDSSDDDSDEDFSVNEDEWRRTIQVGSDFQAVIPEGISHYDNDGPGYDDRFLWRPTPELTDQKIDDYLMEYDKPDDENCGEFVLPSGLHVRDDEQALFTLFHCGYDTEEALKLHENGREPKAPLSDPISPWSEEECRAFEFGLHTHGKDFFQIKHNQVPTRSVGEVISFYYLWKKTERHDLFANRFRLEKKKYSLHPGTTDYMDRFLDEQENVSFNIQPSFISNQLIPTSNVQISINSSSSNHPMNLNQPTTNRQSSLNTAQSSYRSHSSEAYHYNSSISLAGSGHHGRTINVSNDEPQTIHINDSDFVSNNEDKPIVVCTGSNNKGNFYGNTNLPSHSDSSSNTTTIVVGKNPVVIDGTWVSSSSTSSSSVSPHSTSSSTGQSVSIYKIPPHPSSTFNR